MTENESGQPYEASVAIWKGKRPVANGGWLVMDPETFQLFDGKGQRLVEAATQDVWAFSSRFTMGSGVSLRIGDGKFMISPGSGNRPEGMASALRRGGGAAAGAVAVSHGRDFAAEFFAALEAAGGHHGKP